jgi:hypothetical protein
MSNTMTIGQKKAALHADALVAEAERERALLAFERTTLDTLLQRVEAGEFETEDAARTAADLALAGASQSTLDALGARFVDSWTLCQAKGPSRLLAAREDQEWAQARADLQSRMSAGFKGNGFAQSFELELNDDGSATLSADAVNLLVQATTWLNKGKIGKVNGYLKATESSALTLDLVISNPSKVKS